MRGFIVFVVAMTGCARTVSPGDFPCTRDASCTASDAAAGETTTDVQVPPVDAQPMSDPWCARFATLTPGAGPVTGVIPTLNRANGSACAAVNTADVTSAWRVEIPARSLLRLSGRTDSSTAQIEIADACPLTACRSAFLNPALDTSTTEINPTDTPRTLFLRVGTNSPHTGGQYTLRAETLRLQPGSLCDTALRAALDTHIEGDTANGVSSIVSAFRRIAWPRWCLPKIAPRAWRCNPGSRAKTRPRANARWCGAPIP
jgi:hypothetical protein